MNASRSKSVVGILLAYCFIGLGCGGDGGGDEPATGAGGAAGMIGAGGAADMIGAGGAAGMIGTGGMTGAGGATGAGGSTPGSPTFSAIYQEIFVATGCTAAVICHGGSAGNLTLKTKQPAYDALVNVAAMGMNAAGATTMNCGGLGLVRVVPSDPDNSLLVKKVEGTQSCGAVMPPSGTMLTSVQVAQIRMWITAGAMND